MKKLFSSFIACALLLTCLLGTVPALADDSDFPEPNWGYVQDTTPYVNGEINFDDITNTYDMDTGTHTITYIGKGTLTDWEFPWSAKGTDYEVVSQSGNSIELRYINAYGGIPYINAIVDFNSGSAGTGNGTQGAASGSTDAQQQTAGGSAQSSGSDSAAQSTQNETTTAPQTGASLHVVPAVAIGVVCVAIAAVIVVLAVSVHRKKES